MWRDDEVRTLEEAFQRSPFQWNVIQFSLPHLTVDQIKNKVNSLKIKGWAPDSFQSASEEVDPQDKLMAIELARLLSM